MSHLPSGSWLGGIACHGSDYAKALSLPRRTEHDAKAMGQLTDLLRRVQGGDAEARDALFAAAYAELHALAQGRQRHGGRARF